MASVLDQADALLSTLKRILRFWAPHRALGFGLAVTMVLRALFTVVLALAIKFVIDQVIDPSASSSAWLVAAVLLAGLGISLLAGLAAARLSARAAADIIADVRTEIFEHLQRLPMQFYDRVAAGDLISHFSSDIAQLSRGVISKPLVGLRAIAAMALYIPAMFLLDVRLATMATIVIPIVVYAVYRWAPPSAEALDVEKQGIADVLDDVNGNLRAQRLLRAFVLRDQARERFRLRIAHLRDASYRAESRIALEMVLAEYAVEVVKVLIIIVGAVFAFSGSLDPGSFAAFAAIVTEFAYQASVLGMDVLPSIKQSEAGIRRIDALLAIPIRESTGASEMSPTMSTDIDFDGVVLRYHESDPEAQLRGLSMTIPAASYIAIVGPNGSGKSSILNALLGMYELEDGRIMVGGVDHTTIDRDDMRRRVGTAFQETFLFDATVRENVALADDSCSEEELMNALDESGLSKVVAKLPHGMDTHVGSDGVTLSTGEAQRIGLARALLRDPEMLLLDEIASGLDPATEAEVFAIVEELRSGRTIVSVTHRLETVKTADLIVVVEGGRVIETGSFEQLISTDGAFSSMWTKQHGFDVSANGLSARVQPERLGAIPLFSGLDDSVLGDLAAAFHTEMVVHGESVFEEGEAGDSFYVIARGVVEVVLGLGTSGERVIAVLEDGDFFGEMALLSSERRNASVRSRGTATLLRLDRRSFAQFLSTTPSARESIEEVAQQRAQANADVVSSTVGPSGHT
ncbi:MAG: ATP-binding cassette domain-containing protein [Acidimicrobiia bacterium]